MKSIRVAILACSWSFICASSIHAASVEIIVQHTGVAEESTLDSGRVSKRFLQRDHRSVSQEWISERAEPVLLEKLRFESLEEAEAYLLENEIADEDWEPNALWTADVSSQNIEADLSAFDPLLHEQWSLFNGSSAAGLAGGDIAALQAWKLSEGAGLFLVLDSGVDSLSSEVSSRLLHEYNGFTREEGFGASFDDNGHGTHVTTVAVGKRNAEGVMGVAPGSQIGILSAKMLDADNAGDTFTAIRAFNWAAGIIDDYLQEDPLNFVVINMSWGGPTYSSQLEKAMQALSSSRVLMVGSAGNNAADNDQVGYWPCNFDLPHMICTAASDRRDRLTSFSSFGKNSVHLAAPGFNILGAVPGQVNGAGQYIPQFADKSGTSQAAPHVAGAALLAWSLNPELSASEVKQILLESVDIIPGMEDQVLSGGRLNAYRAALMAAGLDTSAANRSFAQLSGPSGAGCQIVARPSARSGVLGFSLIFLALLFVPRRFRRAKEL